VLRFKGCALLFTPLPLTPSSPAAQSCSKGLGAGALRVAPLALSLRLENGAGAGVPSAWCLGLEGAFAAAEPGRVLVADNHSNSKALHGFILKPFLCLNELGEAIKKCERGQGRTRTFSVPLPALLLFSSRRCSAAEGKVGEGGL